MPTRLTASCFALTAFTVALVAGMAAGNAVHLILWRSFTAMLIAWPIGLVISLVARRAIREHIDQYKQQNPIEPLNPQTSNEAGNPSPAPTERVKADTPRERSTAAPV